LRDGKKRRKKETRGSIINGLTGCNSLFLFVCSSDTAARVRVRGEKEKERTGINRIFL
jgi:hypothetical protein